MYFDAIVHKKMSSDFVVIQGRDRLIKKLQSIIKNVILISVSCYNF